MKFTESGKLMKAFRKKAKISQGDLGKAIGLHSQHISNLERQLCFIPKKHLKAYFQALGMSAYDIKKVNKAIIKDETVWVNKKWKKMFASCCG